MKGLADNPNYVIELMEGGVTLEDIFDGHIYEQALVSSYCMYFWGMNHDVVCIEYGFTKVLPHCRLRRMRLLWGTLVP